MTLNLEAAALAPTDPVRVLALTLVGEASSDGANGMQGVASCILRRTAHPGWWGDDIRSVCLADQQFDCWLPGPDRDRILALPPSDPSYRVALHLAQLAAAGTLRDITLGSDSYYAVTIPAPFWVDAAVFKIQIGHQRFYSTLDYDPQKEDAHA